METDDILAYEVNIGRPEFFIKRIILRAVAEGGDVIGQRWKA